MSSEAGLDFAHFHKSDPALANLDVAKYNTVASDDFIEATKKGLEAKQVKVTVVANKADALEALKAAIPANATVNTGHSTSLIEVGFVEHLKKQTEWVNVHGQILAEQDQAKAAVLRAQGAIVDYFVVSASAVAQTGEIISGDLTGTRVNGLVAAKNVVILVGANKLVATEQDGIDRLHNFSLQVESARVRVVYKAPASAVNNVVVLRGPNPWGAPRVHVVIVKELLGF